MRLSNILRMAGCCAMFTIGCGSPDAGGEDVLEREEALSAPSVIAVQSVKDGVFGGAPLRQDGYLVAYGDNMELPKDLYPRSRTTVFFTKDPNDTGVTAFGPLAFRGTPAVYTSPNQINFPVPAVKSAVGDFFMRVLRFECHDNPQGNVPNSVLGD